MVHIEINEPIIEADGSRNQIFRKNSFTNILRYFRMYVGKNEFGINQQRSCCLLSSPTSKRSTRKTLNS